MAFAPDGRHFVCQQGGQVRVIENGGLLSTPFTTVTVTAAGSGRCGQRQPVPLSELETRTAYLAVADASPEYGLSTPLPLTAVTT